RDLRARGAAARRGRARPSDALPHPDRRAAPHPGRAQGGCDRVKIRAAVLERTGGPLHVTELALAGPGPGEVLVRLHASGVCHSDQNAIDGTAETRCPAVLGHEGAGAVEAADPGPQKLADAEEFGATDGVLWAGSPEATADAVREASGGGVDYAIEATGRTDAMVAAFLSTRTRGAAVLIGIPREDAVVSLPALSIPRMERRVLGSLYGSSRPERDFVLILDLYRRGLLPLDRLISHRLGLDELDRAFDLMRSGEALRAVVDLAPDGRA